MGERDEENYLNARIRMQEDIDARMASLRLRTVLTVLGSIASLVTILYWSQIQRRDRSREQEVRATLSVEGSTRELDDLKSQLNETRRLQSNIIAELSALKAGIQSGKSGDSESEAALYRATQAQAEVEKMRMSIDQINFILGDDPAKKMSVILLSRDLASLREDTTKDFSNLREGYKSDLNAVRDDYKSSFDFIKWAIGFVGFANLAGPLLSLIPRLRPDKGGAGPPVPGVN